MDEQKLNSEALLLRTLVFQMHDAGIPQSAIGKYVGKAAGTINAMLKPLPKKER
jgi:hypothetical protein